jgi:hypothetical protein
MRPRDAKRWKAVAIRFKDWLGHDDLGRVTSERVQAWGDELTLQGIKAKTINDTIRCVEVRVQMGKTTRLGGV